MNSASVSTMTRPRRLFTTVITRYWEVAVEPGGPLAGGDPPRCTPGLGGPCTTATSTVTVPSSVNLPALLLGETKAQHSTEHGEEGEKEKQVCRKQRGSTRNANGTPGLLDVHCTDLRPLVRI
jgi:hypothetical protein